MTDDQERNFLMEAQMILKGLTGLLPTKQHLEALQEKADCDAIRLANELEVLKLKVLGMGT